MPKERPVSLSVGDALPIGSRIRLRRLSRGIRLSAMARAIGYDRGYLSHVENNEVTPSAELVEKIAQYLEVSVQDLRQAPIAQLAPGYGVGSGVPLGGAFILTAPPPPPRPRTLAQRIQRILSMAHLTEEEEAVVADYLVATTQAALALVKSTRRLKPKGADESDEED